MNIKKIFMGTILLMAMCFSACSNNDTAVTETSGETVLTAAETASAESETETAVTENQPENFSICGNVYSTNDIYIEIDGNSIAEADMENIRRLKNLSAVSIENPNVPLVEMFAEEPNVTKIELVKFNGDISEYLDALKGFDIVSIDAVRYSGKDSALIYRELSEASVKYEKNSDRLFDLPTDGIALSTSVSILPNGKDDFDTWITPSDVLIIGINNFTDMAQTAQKLELLYESENGDEAVTFKNGENFLPLDIIAEPQGKALLTVDNDMFDYKNAETGVYKVRLTLENDTAEAEFVIANSSGLEFLTEEQRELFDKTWKLSVDHTSEAWIYSDSWTYEKEPVNISDEALEMLCECYTYDYVIEHSDRFCINSEGGLYETDGRSGSPVYEVTFFSPISVSEEQVDFKATVVNFHGDDPYFVWFYELNYRMVKTDSGWRFDKFQFWR
ncbi:MAG: hypothetical protein K2N60_11170 [Oscillospiraceae bacterium]|nr:hypothetical protein [Oscillospiraceae bacterium]